MAAVAGGELALRQRHHAVADPVRRHLQQILEERDRPRQLVIGEDVREGLTAIISVKLRDPQFEGQTKAKLGNTEMRSLVERATNEHFGRICAAIVQHMQRLHVPGSTIASLPLRDALRRPRRTILERLDELGRLMRSLARSVARVRRSSTVRATAALTSSRYSRTASR